MYYCIIALLMLFSSPSEKQTMTNNQHVTVEMHYPVSMSLSVPALCTFFFTPSPGIHLNTAPIIELRLEKKSQFELVGNPTFQKNEQEYLDISAPVEFSIHAKKGTAPGKQPLKGTLNYFYCSDKDGWCNRFSQPIEVTVELSK